MIKSLQCVAAWQHCLEKKQCSCRDFAKQCPCRDFAFPGLDSWPDKVPAGSEGLEHLFTGATTDSTGAATGFIPAALGSTETFADFNAAVSGFTGAVLDSKEEWQQHTKSWYC